MFGTVTYIHLFLLAIRYSALLIPSGLGCSYDLANHKDLGKILNEFIEDRSKWVSLIICDILFILLS